MADEDDDVPMVGLSVATPVATRTSHVGDSRRNGVLIRVLLRECVYHVYLSFFPEETVRRPRRSPGPVDRTLMEPVLVAIFSGSPGKGRWADLRPDVEAEALVLQELQSICDQASVLPTEPPAGIAVVGFVIMRWCFELPGVTAPTLHSELLGKVLAGRLNAGKRKCLFGTIAYEMVDQVRLCHVVSVPEEWASAARVGPETGAALIPHGLWRALAEARVVTSRGEETFSKVIWQRWADSYKIVVRHCVGWCLVQPMAFAMVSGLWRQDVVAVRRREEAPCRLERGKPPRWRVTQYIKFLKKGVAQNRGSDGQAAIHPLGKRRRKGAPASYHPAHVIKAVAATKHITSLTKGWETVRSHMEFLFPGNAQHTLPSDFECPSKQVLIRGRIRLDVACMLQRRQWYAEKGPTFRYLTYDASPQGGLEVFATVEDVVPRADVVGRTLEVVDASVLHRVNLPLVVLGTGRTGLVDKAAAHVHQGWVHYGARLRLACLDVRGVCTDLGTEFGIGDYPDIGEHVATAALALKPDDVRAARAARGFDGADRTYLYPFALSVPGVMHTIDWGLKLALSKMSFWSTWESNARSLSNFLRNRSYREKLQSLLEETPHGLHEGDIRETGVGRTMSVFLLEGGGNRPPSLKEVINLPRFFRELAMGDSPGSEQAVPAVVERAEARLYAV